MVSINSNQTEIEKQQCQTNNTTTTTNKTGEKKKEKRKTQNRIKKKEEMQLNSGMIVQAFLKIMQVISIVMDFRTPDK